jgi:hypothetical protein
MEFIIFQIVLQMKKLKFREVTAKDHKARKEQNWDLKLGLLIVTLSFPRLLLTGFYANSSHFQSQSQSPGVHYRRSSSLELAICLGSWI